MRRTLLLSLALCCGTPALADSYRNCGQDWQRPAAAPARIVALNQHAADLLLALGAGPSMVGVAYLDDNGAAYKQGRYQGVPVIAREYPASEVLYAQRPDLVVGGFATAFGDGITSRSRLAGNGIVTYLLESACNGHSLDYYGHVRRDLTVLGELLGRQARAQALIEAMETDLAQARAIAPSGKPLSVFYLDSEVRGLDSEGGRGFVTPLLAAAGARNVLAGIDQYRVTINREALLSSDPDVILLADALWSPASRKRQLLTRDPVLSSLRAVRENRMIDIPFTQLMPTPASGRVALELARQLRGMAVP
ncbi:ABC transporter substrate-binding protein [Pseudomonas soli]|jgi:iron complex transport system substrate-binding protein|uniref:ABC transporter substrate-binding protein n=1 Tax=Pseudomonas soli TaxID=1306993 RepID=A0A1H9UC05_9PSED|nr:MULTISPECIES: ABC transporter substrate-binding protein [Pseudomonas]AUY31781.1 iron ABC transporter substrate-binding protein [Pseudomonas sp. PONIH3]MEE1883518.1 ABC transporter substrate-binding protein [Pseudomonas soli]SES06684.1 iron complex transport system substrate-binding protein [Pseudomonas soli]